MMCFYNDYDWTAELVVTDAGRSGPQGPAPRSKCDECGQRIPIGAWRMTVFMQEHEECQVCESDWSDLYIDGDGIKKELDEMGAAGESGTEWHVTELARLENHRCTYGETFHYTRCESCDKILRAIEAHEVAAGCPVVSQRPALCELWEEISQHSDGPTYLMEAVSAFPEIAEHPLVVEYLRENA